MTEGDANGQPFTFPIPTVNITEEFDWDGENTELLFENTAKIGSSYFQNFIGSQYKLDEEGNKVENENAYKPNAVRSMCCRLQLDLRELLKRGNGLFGSAEMTGSIGVVTINMARLGYLYRGNETELYKQLDKLLYIAKSTLEKKTCVHPGNVRPRFISVHQTLFATFPQPLFDHWCERNQRNDCQFYRKKRHGNFSNGN